jgi:drug/metabolite transporter (DMT)-like permease
MMAYVSALRETSVIIAAIIGSIFLGEPFGRMRIGAAALVAIGLFVLNGPAL